MSEEEQEAIAYIKAFQKDLYGASEKNLMAIYIDRVWNYIDKLQKENEELKDEIELHKADENTLQDLIREDEENINKLINYIAVRENKDYEDIRKEFDI